MATRCSECVGRRRELCDRAYYVSAEKMIGCAETAVTLKISGGRMLDVAAKTKAEELGRLSYFTTELSEGCTFSDQEQEHRLDEYIGNQAHV